MPSRIDRADHFRRITQATAHLAAREGVAAASLRRVAAETGLTLSAVRHLCPDSETLHARTVKWLRSQEETDGQPYYTCTTPAEALARLLENLVPRSDDAILRARAWSAFRRHARTGSLTAQVIEAHERRRIREVEQVLDSIRRELESEPRPGKVVLASEVRPPHPDNMRLDDLFVLALVTGVSSLLVEHRISLGADAAERCLRRLETRHLDWPA